MTNKPEALELIIIFPQPGIAMPNSIYISGNMSQLP